MPNVIKLDTGSPLLQEPAQPHKICSSCARPLSLAADNSDLSLVSDYSPASPTMLCAACHDGESSHEAHTTVNGSGAAEEKVEGMASVSGGHPATLAITIPKQESSVAFPSFGEVLGGANNSPILNRGRPLLSHPRQDSFGSHILSTSPSARIPFPGSHARVLSLSPPGAALASKSRGLSPLTPSIAASTATLNPLVDISRLRVRSQGHDCLYPGATFTGYQTNNSKQHKVSVTILDVDLPAATLCGFMSIRGLTKQPEEMVTYFDGQIIGSRHGFLTQEWGSTDEYDLKHWERFPAFHGLPKKKFRYPRMTIKDDDNRGFVFMRWKEKFLYPDHKVQTINGASFAGFYYICLEFGNNGHQDSDDEGDDMDDEDEDMDMRSPSTDHHHHDELHGMDLDMAGPLHAAHLDPDKYPPHHQHSQHHNHHNTDGRDDVHRLPIATLTGYYFHSEREVCDLYQKLHLHHTPKNTHANFEFR